MIIPDFMLPAAGFSWEAIAAWFAVGWTGLMTYSCMGAFWWRALVPKHCERCNYCEWKGYRGKLEMYGDHEMQFFFGAALWPLSSALLFLRLLIWKPIVAAVLGIITPAPLALEPEPEVPTTAVVKHYDDHDVIEHVPTSSLTPTPRLSQVNEFITT